MILSDQLHAKANRVVFEYNSIVLLKACCAPDVILMKKTFNNISFRNKRVDRRIYKERSLGLSILTGK